jgi:hypothetical protein
MDLTVAAGVNSSRYIKRKQLYNKSISDMKKNNKRKGRETIDNNNKTTIYE